MTSGEPLELGLSNPSQLVTVRTIFIAASTSCLKQPNTSSRACIIVHHPYLLVATSSNLAAASLLNITVPLIRTYSLQWVLTVLSIFYLGTITFSQRNQHTQVMFCCRHKTTLILFSEFSFSCLWNAPHRWYNWRFSTTFYNKIQLSISIHASWSTLKYHLTSLEHAFIQPPICSF